MKKLFNLSLAFLVLFSLVACNKKQEDKQTKFKAGKYVANKMGHNGSIEVETEFSDDKIVDVKILKNEETKVIATIALEQLPKRIVESQSLDVELFTGATVSSNAIINAVSDCIKQAGANPDELKSVVEKQKPSSEVQELTTDVLVVGAGGAGMGAAIRADQAGLKVILLEKNAMVGGHTALSGAYTLITGSKLQKEKYGVTNDSLEAVYEDNFVNGQEKSVEEDLHLFTEIMGPATDWYDEYVKLPAPDKLTPLSENKIDRAMVYQGGGKGLNEALLKKLKETKVDLKLETKAESLIVENDTVVGVNAKDSLGNQYKILAKAVVLATGSYGARKDMLPESLSNFVYYGAQLAQGEGLEMAKKVGAATVNQGYVELFENGVEWLPGIAKSTYSGSMSAWTVSGILVDRNGNRVVNETAPGIEIVKEMSKQNDGRLFLLMDKNTFETFRKNVAGYGISQQLLDQWLEQNGKTKPYFAHGNSLEEVAKALNINAENLKKTVEKYNGFVEKGVDDDFNRDAKKMTAKIGEGPYYLVEQLPRYATTLGGLKINDKLQVLTKDNKVIDGLYAAGDVAGGARGSDSIPGADVAWALQSGYKVGEVLAEKLAN